MLIVPAVVGGSALGAAVVSMFMARVRIPKQFRSFRAGMKVSLSCVHASHMRCDDHLHCPCACHDAVIYAAIATRWEDALRPTAETNEF